MATITHLASQLLSDPTDHDFECRLCGQAYEAPRENCPACGSLDIEAC